VNDSELNNLLRRVRVPERNETEWKEFAGDTMRRLRTAPNFAGDDVRSLTSSRRTETETPHVVSYIKWWAAGVAVACLLIGLFIGQSHSRRTGVREIVEARKLFSELNAMFPNQLQAVLLDGAAPQLVLSEKAATDKGVPLFVRVCGPKGCQRIITFSGESVRVNGELCEVLMGAQGEIIVAGEHFAWSSRATSSHGAGYHVEAVALTQAL
jgi:hypothetical protein